MTEKKSSRNHTVTLTDEEYAQYLSQCLRPVEALTLNGCSDRVLCGDTFRIMPLLPKQSVDLLIVDPPYNLEKNYNGTPFHQQAQTEYIRYTEQWLGLARPLLKPNACIYVCCDWKTGILIAPILQKYFFLQNRITWQREKGRGAKSNWKNSMEDIWFATNSKSYPFYVDNVKIRRRVLAPYRQNGQPKDWESTPAGNFRNTCPSNFWDDISIPYWSMPENTEHPTQKPEKLIAKLILSVTKPGDVVLDPFLGSGTTAVTAQKLGRHFIGIEWEEKYCALSAKRLAAAKENPSIQGYTDGIFWERNTSLYQKKKNNQ